MEPVVWKKVGVLPNEEQAFYKMHELKVYSTPDAKQWFYQIDQRAPESGIRPPRDEDDRPIPDNRFRDIDHAKHAAVQRLT